MFTPLNVKKLTNVSVIALKKYNKRYEIAVYPNKLYEYQRNITTRIEDILCNLTIYKNVSKGEVASKADLSLFNTSKINIIKEILDTGHEQKNEVTRNHELAMAENEIINLVQNKVTKDGRFLSAESLREVIGKIHRISLLSIKKQVQDIICKLEKLGFERVKMKISIVDRNKTSDETFKDYGDFTDNFLFVKSDVFPKFRSFCDENKIKYTVYKNIENAEEEIL